MFIIKVKNFITVFGLYIIAQLVIPFIPINVAAAEMVSSQEKVDQKMPALNVQAEAVAKENVDRANDLKKIGEEISNNLGGSVGNTNHKPTPTPKPIKYVGPPVPAPAKESVEPVDLPASEPPSFAGIKLPVFNISVPLLDSGATTTIVSNGNQITVTRATQMGSVTQSFDKTTGVVTGKTCYITCSESSYKLPENGPQYIGALKNLLYEMKLVQSLSRKPNLALNQAYAAMSEVAQKTENYLASF